jgi:hypothetical protein
MAVPKADTYGKNGVTGEKNKRVLFASVIFITKLYG